MEVFEPASKQGLTTDCPHFGVRVIVRLAVYHQSVHLGTKPLRTQNQYFFQLSNCGYSPDITSSLMRGWVCRLKLLWSSPAQSFSGLSLAGLVTIFYCPRLETPPTWRTRSPYLYPPGAGRPSYVSRHRVPFSSPLTTRRVTVEVFEPASARNIFSSFSDCLSSPYVMSARIAQKTPPPTTSTTVTTGVA
jgi:hypothetical protein